MDQKNIHPGPTFTCQAYDICMYIKLLIILKAFKTFLFTSIDCLLPNETKESGTLENHFYIQYKEERHF